MVLVEGAGQRHPLLLTPGQVNTLDDRNKLTIPVALVVNNALDLTRKRVTILYFG